MQVSAAALVADATCHVGFENIAAATAMFERVLSLEDHEGPASDQLR